jgi:hypothetical protein
MYHMGARYYDPTIARFTQQDPQSGNLSSPLTLNRYLYANDNPVNSCDPTGRFCLAEASIFGLGALAAGLFALADPEVFIFGIMIGSSELNVLATGLAIGTSLWGTAGGLGLC